MSHRNPDPSRLTSVDATKTVGDNLKGIEVISMAGRRLGAVVDFLLSSDGQVDAVIVETPGILGLGAKRLNVKVDGLDLLVDPYDKFFLRVVVPNTSEQAAIASTAANATAPDALGQPTVQS